MSFTILLSFSNIDNQNKKTNTISQHLYISPAMQVSIWPVVIIPRLNSEPIHFSFKTLPQGKFFLTKSCLRDINLKETLWFFDKICSQMLNNFTAFSTVLYNFHVALFSLIKLMIYFHHFTVKIFLLSDCSFTSKVT